MSLIGTQGPNYDHEKIKSAEFSKPMTARFNIQPWDVTRVSLIVIKKEHNKRHFMWGRHHLWIRKESLSYSWNAYIRPLTIPHCTFPCQVEDSSQSSNSNSLTNNTPPSFRMKSVLIVSAIAALAAAAPAPQRGRGGGYRGGKPRVSHSWAWTVWI